MLQNDAISDLAVYSSSFLFEYFHFGFQYCFAGRSGLPNIVFVRHTVVLSNICACLDDYYSFRNLYVLPTKHAFVYEKNEIAGFSSKQSVR